MKPHHFYFFWLLLILFLGSCNTTKHLKDGELLVKKNSVSLDVDLKKSEFNSLQYQLSTLAKPKPNAKTLVFFRTRLWWHYKLEKNGLDTANTSKFRKFMLRRVAQKPVIYTEDMALSNAKTMEYYLNNKGYFDAKVDFEVDTVRKKLTKIRYIAKANKALNIGEVEFNCSDKEIQTLLEELAPKTNLKKGTPIDKKRFSQEKNRITADLRNRGYIYFYPNYIYFTADSSNNVANVRVDVAPPPDAPVYAYHIGKITVHTDYRPTGSLYRDDKGVQHGDFYFIEPDSGSIKIKLEPIAEAIRFKTGDLYTLENQQATNKKLGLLNVYKFISVKFTPNDVIDADGKRYLDCNIYLTPLKKMELGGDIEINSIEAQTFRGVGTFLNLNYKNRNVFKGAELFNLNITGGIEFLRAKRSDGEKGLLKRNTLDIRLSSDLYFPSISFRNAPLRASFNYNYLSRVDQFTYNLLSLASGFDWQFSKNAKASWNFINLNYLSPSIDSVFQIQLDQDPLLASSFDPQLIPQGTVDYTYTLFPDSKGNSWVFHSTFEYAGFLVNALDRFVPNREIRFGDITYSQFFRFDVDIRYTKKVRKNSWAFRFNVGLAKPYGNSATTGIPYVKQFFAGGNSSLRAWRVRELGPGSYINYSNFYNNNVPFQTGDVKLEFNAEYRFSMKAIYSTMEGAIFTDIGNVWSLTDSDPSKRFKSNFYEELAVASGVGLRLDFDFFIVRFDLGWRMRYPYSNDKGQHWLIRPPVHIDRPFAPRAQFGIGYPF